MNVFNLKPKYYLPLTRKPGTDPINIFSAKFYDTLILSTLIDGSNFLTNQNA